MEYTKIYTEKVRIERDKYKTALLNLVDAVKSSGAAEAVVSNDLGNALEAADEILRRDRK